MLTLAMTMAQRGEAFGTGLVLLVVFGFVVAYFLRTAIASGRRSDDETTPMEDQIAQELSKPGPPRFNG